MLIKLALEVHVTHFLFVNSDILCFNFRLRLLDLLNNRSDLLNRRKTGDGDHLQSILRKRANHRHTECIGHGGIRGCAEEDVSILRHVLHETFHQNLDFKERHVITPANVHEHGSGIFQK